MKHSTTVVMIIAILGGFGNCLLSGAFAEEKPITSSLGNPKIKLIGELTLPSAINKIVFEKGKDGKSKIGKILIKDGFYSVDDKYGVKSILDLNRWKTDKERFRFEEAISNDGNYAIATTLVQSPTDSAEYWPGIQYIVNLRTGEKIQIGGDGWPAFSDNTIMFCYALGVFSTSCFDLKANLLKDYMGREAVTQIVGHKYGFFGAGSARFFDQTGNILKTYEDILQPEFRVIYDTGQVALHYCIYDESGKPKESKVGIYDWKGEIQHEMTLPFDLNVDLGFSPDGRYVVVGAYSGWVKLLDMENEKELWTKEMKVGKAFYWHMPFPVTEAAQYFALYTIEEKSNKYMITIFSYTGQVVGYIEVNLRKGMEETRLEFIPGSSILIFYSDKYINLYKIED